MAPLLDDSNIFVFILWVLFILSDLCVIPWAQQRNQRNLQRSLRFSCCERLIALPPLAIPPRPEQHAALMAHMCTVCFSVCHGCFGCWLATVCVRLSACGSVCVCFKKKKKKKGAGGWKRRVWGKETNYMSTKWGGALCLATYQPMPTSTHTHTHTHTHVHRLISWRKSGQRGAVGVNMWSISWKEGHILLSASSISPLCTVSLFRSAGHKHKGK